MTVILKGDSMEEIDFGESEVQRICRLFSVTPVREGWVTQATFFNQFPTYETYPRTYRYLSRVVAMAISFDKPSEGFAKSDWGPGAITVFRTLPGRPIVFSSMFRLKIRLLPTVVLSARPDKVKRRC